MTIEQAGSVGEVVGALATVATLAYLAVQIRANTRMMRTQATHVSQAQSAQLSMGIAQDRQLAGILRRGLGDFESLEPDEQIQFTFLFSQFLSVAELVFRDVENGVSGPAELERTWSSIRPLARTPGGREFWARQGRVSYPPDFRSFVESELSS